jgi:hypothetical protein
MRVSYFSFYNVLLWYPTHYAYAMPRFILLSSVMCIHQPTCTCIGLPSKCWWRFFRAQYVSVDNLKHKNVKTLYQNNSLYPGTLPIERDWLKYFSWKIHCHFAFDLGYWYDSRWHFSLFFAAITAIFIVMLSCYRAYVLYRYWSWPISWAESRHTLLRFYQRRYISLFEYWG